MSMSRRSLRRDVPNHSMSTTSSTTSITPSDSILAAAGASAVESDDTATNRTSWVWQYFSTVTFPDKTIKNVCRANRGFHDKPQDLDAPVVVCQEAITIDKSSSTRSMARHLSRAHRIEPPINTTQQTLTSFTETGKNSNVSFTLFSFISSL